MFRPVRRRHAAGVLACVLAFAAPGLQAAEWFVSPLGDDAGDGSEQRPFRTVGRVLAPGSGVVAPGDTVTLLAPPGNGTYHECDVRLRMPLTLRSPPGERAHIHCDIDTADSVTVQIDPDASGSRLSNLEISGGRYYGVMLQTNWYQGGPAGDTGATGVVLEDLLIHDTGRDGIKITPKSDNATIRRVEIHHTGRIDPPGAPLESRNADGIDNVNGSGMVVEDSYIHDIATTGVYFKGGAADVLVQRNRIENTGMAGILAGFDTSPEFFDLQLNPAYHESIRGTVRDNLVRNTGYAGIGLYAALDAVVADNTIIDVARLGHAGLYYGIAFQDHGPHPGRPPSIAPRVVNNRVAAHGGRCLEIRHSHEFGGLSALRGGPGTDYNDYQEGCRFVDQRAAGLAARPLSLQAWQAATGADRHSAVTALRLDGEGGAPSGNTVPAAGAVPVEAAIQGAAEEVAVSPAKGAAIPLLGWLALLAVVCVLAALAALVYLAHRRNVAGWLFAWLRQDWRAPVPPGTTRHLLFCFVDHYEPGWGGPGLERERARVARWRQELPSLCAGHRDADGRPPVHSFFFPGEEYRPEHIDTLVELCRLGLGEIEIHLHHEDDTEAGLRQSLSQFTGVLADRHDALPRDPLTGQPRWAFIHGNWALDNSHPQGRHCGVDNELVVLREEGCYADFTFPAAPDPCQPRTINRIYHATDDPARPKSHDRGQRVRVGGVDEGDLMIIQGPLGLRWKSRKFGLIPRIENADVRAVAPPSRDRIDAWVDTGIHVEGRPEWIFVKIHTHGAEDADMDTLLGPAMDQAFTYLESRYNDGRDWKLHYVSAREMYNIAKAAAAGKAGEPGLWRDYCIPRPGYAAARRRAA
ncbi:right-handed parallel beta-helix repeat-containing protein [Lysobacter sp. GX 14042]|uniref:right-handed parallel beta-helix repeat-containing protein n=1 Tax=Lysobacter sp. GX 14042 TaxID=2907155 RepID=UPI001F457519|nr:right-handed parallel beta-helix repeat-containing protein [Lysobacter sp. GX 14042]MCE7032679.1 right-handed parallel beta-helix repeat-containing protein [Lysobacter sp. GX 14042]